MPSSLLQQLRRHAVDRPTHPAITHAASQPAATRDLTWAALLDAVMRCAALLQPRLSPGDVLLLCTTNRAEFTVAFLAAMQSGLRVFPINPNLTAPEIRQAAERSAARAIIAGPEAAESAGVLLHWPADELLARCAETTPLTGEREVARSALLLQSSGTTGLPKIVVRTGQSLDLVARAMAESVGFTPADRVLQCVPLCHSYGVEHGLLAPLWAGSHVRLCQGFDLPTVEAELDAGATIFPGVPFVYETLARHAAGKRFPALRRAYSAGGPLPAAVRDACRSELGLVVSQLYGATEIGSVTFANPDLPGYNAGSVGRPMLGVDVCILPAAGSDGATERRSDEGNGIVGDEPGQVAIRSAYRLTGYLDGSPPPLTADGYFLTGDLGIVDLHGNLTLTGRLKLLIDVGGLKVNPLEVEAALCEHADVAECVVLPVAVTETVTRLKAVIVRSPGASATGEQLRQFLRGRLAPYKVPRVYEFRDSLPRSAAGKVLRQQVDKE